MKIQARILLTYFAIFAISLLVRGVTLQSSENNGNCARADITYDPATSKMRAEWTGINFEIKSSTGGAERGPVGPPGPPGPAGSPGTSIEDVKKEISGMISNLPVSGTQGHVDHDLRARVAKLEETVRSIVSMPERKPKIKPNVPLEVPAGEIDILGWVPASNGYEYFISGKVSYESAKKFCESREAKLATVGVRDKVVLGYLLEKFIKKRGVSVWIGLNDTESEGDWYWEDGVKSTMFNTPWFSTSPTGVGDCGYIVYTTGTVSDYKCRYSRRALCER